MVERETYLFAWEITAITSVFYIINCSSVTSIIDNYFYVNSRVKKIIVVDEKRRSIINILFFLL